ncbi:MAG: class I SAM-dependent methyltransferase [Verrucomicrobia bacterium]|nr:class I SAM-dependent methyltransferase [Verrucomicrobiota bacterium]
MTAKQRKLPTPVPHRHTLYAAAVQSVEADMAFAARVFRRRNGRAPVRLKEDFCGTAKLACAWAALRPDHQAWGIDLDAETLEWGREHYWNRLGQAAHRVHLIEGDVLTTRTPPVDVTLALNFSYCIFKQRETLMRYFDNVHHSLDTGGVLILDVFGGSGAFNPMHENRMVRDEVDDAGRRIPQFKFIWEQQHFDAVSHEILCHIHFKLRQGRMLRRAFTYDWRVWSIAELRDLLAECGYTRTDVYTHGWDTDGESNGVYRPVKRMENTEGWIAYIVAAK